MLGQRCCQSNLRHSLGDYLRIRNDPGSVLLLQAVSMCMCILRAKKLSSFLLSTGRSSGPLVNLSQQGSGRKDTLGQSSSGEPGGNTSEVVSQHAPVVSLSELTDQRTRGPSGVTT